MKNYWDNFEIWLIQTCGKGWAFVITRIVMALGVMLVWTLGTLLTWQIPRSFFTDGKEPVSDFGYNFLRMLLGGIPGMAVVLVVLLCVAVKEIGTMWWEGFNNKYPEQDKKADEEEISFLPDTSDLDDKIMDHLRYWQEEVDRLHERLK